MQWHHAATPASVPKLQQASVRVGSIRAKRGIILHTVVNASRVGGNAHGVLKQPAKRSRQAAARVSRMRGQPQGKSQITCRSTNPLRAAPRCKSASRPCANGAAADRVLQVQALNKFKKLTAGVLIFRMWMGGEALLSA